MKYVVIIQSRIEGTELAGAIGWAGGSYRFGNPENSEECDTLEEAEAIIPRLPRLKPDEIAVIKKKEPRQ